MKIIADDKIPFITDFFSAHEVVLLPGESITHTHLESATILLTRTVTTVNEALLKNTPIKWVGTVTTGTDHIDTPWLSENNITLATAAGANSSAVAEYVMSCVAALMKSNLLSTQNVTAGIIGCGRIGKIVARSLQKLGCSILCYDPFLTEKLDFNFVSSLTEIFQQSQLISIHTPLTKTGLFPTFRMINKKLLSKLKYNTILINTARGAVVDQHDLLKINHLMLCWDVWENEPAISLPLLSRVFIGTPHIAGYTQTAKYRATQMIYEQAAAYFGWKPIDSIQTITPTVCANYDLLIYTKQFRNAFQCCDTEEKIKNTFIHERKIYPWR
ncbi:MAG: hypothetical protein A3E53_01090 [Gammaproteobacteria bacterium RIFCSPHIGHO2_12_FULL_39_24]|nr:MAG: hypothetical protein A3E53_01090 [Gammaproteobacteria bacterium RIFCSPHIGHO2_12_FULL_39_24]